MAKVEGYNLKRVKARQASELLGLCRGMTADGRINEAEAEFLHKWLVSNEELSTTDRFVATLMLRVDEMLSDGELDSEESAELLETLRHYTGGDFELGDTMPSVKVDSKILHKKDGARLNNKERLGMIQGASFCFTGTFAYGKRADCHNLTTKHGGVTSNKVTKELDYLVVGKYATKSWIQSSYGRKIEYAQEIGTVLLSEDDWLALMHG